MRLYKYLTESLLEVDKRDIDFLFKPFKPWLKKFKELVDNRDSDGIYSLFKSMYSLPSNEHKDVQYIKKYRSKDLKSKEAKLAHKVKPIDIFIGFPIHSSAYYADDKYIMAGISIVQSMAEFRLIDITSSNPFKDVKEEWSEVKIKASIRHELTHWLDDTKHNLFITKNVKRAADIISKKGYKEGILSMKGNKPHMYLTPQEINAMIHSIAELKEIYSEKWDKMTFDDMISLTPALSVLNKELGYKWRKEIKKRMARENLFGKKMK